MSAPTVADTRQNRNTPPARPAGSRVPKADADVADLLGVNALADHAAAPAPLSRATDDTSDVLNDLVEDHLQRAADASPNPVSIAPAEGERVDLLRAEIEALLAAPAEQPAASAEPHKDDVEILPTSIPASNLSNAELAVLLPPTGPELDGDSLNAAETFQGAAAVAAELDSEVTLIQAADDELTRELLALQLDQDATTEPDAGTLVPTSQDSGHTQTLEAIAVPERDPAPTLEAHPLPEVPGDTVAASPPIPVVILQPDAEEESAEHPSGLMARVKRAASETALMTAQLLDLPFSWLNGIDKQLLGVAAIVFFLSGCVLVFLGWYLGAR